MVPRRALSMGYLLLDLPDGFVKLLEVVRDLRDPLDAPLVRDELGAHLR
jgi:hypothetical protein